MKEPINQQETEPETPEFVPDDIDVLNHNQWATMW